MSVAKRDNYVFHLAKAAAEAPPRPVPRNPEPRPNRMGEALDLQGSWNEATTRGGDPYNNSGTRTRS
jgi:hypothetical protein